MKCILETLETNEKRSGQSVSKEKSSIMFSKQITLARRRVCLSLMGFSEGVLPFKYLGVPIFSRKLKAIHFYESLSKIRDRIGGWKANLLSTGARVLLLKHVLGSMPIHLFSILQVPKSVIAKLNSLFSNLF